MWDLSHEEKEVLVCEEEKNVWTVSWSPDGSQLAWDGISSGKNVIRIVDSSTGERLENLIGHENLVNGVAWSPNGRQIGSASSDGTVRVWDVGGGQSRVLPLNAELSEWHRPIFWSIAWSPEGQFLAAGDRAGSIDIWNVESGTSLHLGRQHKSSVRSLSWSAESLVLASASHDGSVRLVAAQDGEELIVLKDHHEAVMSVAFAPGGGRLASAAVDGTVRIWDVSDVAPKGKQRGTRKLIEDIESSEYVERQGLSIGRRPRSGISKPVKEEPLWVPTILPGQDGECLGELNFRDPSMTSKPLMQTCTCLVPGTIHALNGPIGLQGGLPELAPQTTGLSAMRPLVFCGHSNVVTCLDLTNGERVWSNDQGGDKTSASVSPDGRFLAVSANADEESSFNVYDARTGAIVFSCTGHTSPVDCVRWSPDGQAILTGARDNTMRVWDSRTGNQLRVIEIGNSTAVWGVAWSPNSRWLASCSIDKEVRIWESSNGAEPKVLEGHRSAVYGLTWSPCGRWLASGSDDNSIIVWDLDSETERFRCTGHKGEIRGIEYSADGRWLASAGYYKDHMLRVWDAQTGEERAQFETQTERGWWDVAWSADGAFLAAADRSGVVKLFDTRELALEARRDAATSKEKESYSPVYGLPPKSAGGLRFNQSSATNDQSGDSGDVPSGPPLSSREARLIRGLGTMRSLHIHPPLSVIDDLVELLGGLDDQVGGAFGCLSVVEGMRKLVSLRWPRDARLGLAAFLLHEVPFTEEWTPPEDWSVDELSDTLFSALNGAEQVDPEVPFASLIHIKKSLDQVDDRLLTFLKILGPETVAKNPSILVMQRHRLPMIPATVTANHRWIGQHVSLHESGRSSGVSGGGTSSGIETRGRIQHVLPWQWLLDSDEFDYRYAQSDLLYRSFEGADPPKLRPTVILLDVSPPVFGPVEMITRPAADSVARTLLRHQLPVVLITTGVRQTGHEGYFELKSASDLLHIWTESTLEPANYGRALQLAQSAQRWLSTGSEPASILVFSHPWFGGSSRSNFPELSHLRGLFVQYPKHPHVQPSIHDLCEKWECLSPTVPDRLAGILGKLVG